MIVHFQWLRGTAARWAARNPILGPGEPGYEKDTNKVKVGDGVTPWNELEYVKAETDTGPDDGTSFELLYQNAKV